MRLYIIRTGGCMENNEAIKLSFAKNINKFNFSTLISVPIDTNVNIKTILNMDSKLINKKVEPGSGKVNFSGKILLNILYVDTDNMTNTISETQAFSETITDPAITAESFVTITSVKVVDSVVSNVGSLKVNCDVSVESIVYLNLNMSNTVANYENMIVKKNVVDACTITDVVNTKFDYVVNMETKDMVNKLLCYNSYFAPTSVTACDDYAIVEGKIFSKLLYETSVGDNIAVKELTDSFAVKTELPIANLNHENSLDLSFFSSSGVDNIQTEIEENNTTLTITHDIEVYGVACKSIAIDVVDDLYSTDNEINPTFATREYNKMGNCEHYTGNITGEITINENETAIDEIVANLNIVPEITNTYVKDETIYIEGIISSQLIYLDENRELKSKQTELPFVANTKIHCSVLDCHHLDISVTDSKAKAKRGTIIELEYGISVCICCYQKGSFKMVDNLSIGKALDFGMFDYQIFIAKPDETMWDLCKRIKINPDEIGKYNPNLPLVMTGGEKVIVKR